MANGPFLDTVGRLGLGAVVIAKKETDEPLKEALHLWTRLSAHEMLDDLTSSLRS